MVIVMDTSSGKILDEACNRYNEVYSDEVLYASWAEVPRAGLQPVDTALAGAAAGNDAEGYLTRLYSSQGQQGRNR